MKTIRPKKEDGASLVEFAIIAPLLILLLFGIIEFGWGLAQHLDVRHMAREALRVAIVDATTTEVLDRVCTDDIVPADLITLIERDGGIAPGDPAIVTITADLQQITGLFSAFWGAAPTLSSTVEGRVEQPTTNWVPAVEPSTSDDLTCP